MCYFEMTRWNCGYWRWGSFRQQCNKEYRTGETCGMKLVFDTIYDDGVCKVCLDIEKKQRRLAKLKADVERWRMEGNRTATIEKAYSDMAEIEEALQRLFKQHEDKLRSLG